MSPLFDRAAIGDSVIATRGRWATPTRSGSEYASVVAIDS
jgi:hypothetical protein